MKGLILVVGSDGMVGSRFIELSKRKNFLHMPTQLELDITRPEDIVHVVNNYNFSAVVNFAAFTDVDEAEKQKGDKNGECWEVNTNGVRNIISAIKPQRAKIHYIQISTDMVFSGDDQDPGPYPEKRLIDINPDKLTWYGYTKAEAEKIVFDELGEFASIVRIGNPVRAKYNEKLDYFRKPLKLYDEGKLYPLFSDQQISISYIDEMVSLIDAIIIQNKKGIYHVASSDVTTPFEIISYLIEKTKRNKDVLKSTSISDFLKEPGKSPARYPVKGGLDAKRTKVEMGVNFKTCREIVDDLVEKGISYS